MSKIIKWAKLIQECEGWYPSSRSQRNQNPGNLRWHNQRGNIGKDNDGFAMFPDYETGFSALVRQLDAACRGRSKVYNPEMTLKQFFYLYAPSDNLNDPDKYSKKVADKLGVDINIKIKNLL